MKKSATTITEQNSPTMYMEISATVSYLLSHLYTKLPRRRVDNYGEELEKCLFRKLQPYWFPEAPSKDSTKRCLQVCGPHADFIFAEAAVASGLDLSEIQACLPTILVFSIDPGYVACQIGSSGLNENMSVVSSKVPWNTSVLSSTSLSSSGCSSASSTSSNASVGSWPHLKEHILYAASQASNVTVSQKGEKEANIQSTDMKKNFDYTETHLATEAALSVLTEPDEILNEIFSSKPNSDLPINKLEKNSSTVSERLNTGTTTQDFDQLRISNINEDESSILSKFDQASRLCAPNMAPRYNDGNGIAMRNQIVPSFIPTDATGDGRFYDHFATDSFNKPGSTEVESSFSFPNKPIHQHIIDGAGINDYPQMKQFPQLPLQQNFNTTANFIQKSTPTPSFTAASFAQTKFGSTKLKCQTKRPHRLVSPCDLPCTTYPSQLLEASIPPLTTTCHPNENCINPGGTCRADAYGSPNVYADHNRINYGNYTCQNDRQHEITNNGVLSGYLDGVSYNSNNSSFRSGSTISNNPVWSQFEKIRNEFQLKNSQYQDENSTDITTPNFRTNINNHMMLGAYNGNFNEFNASTSNNFEFSNRKDTPNIFGEYITSDLNNQCGGYQSDQFADSLQKHLTNPYSELPGSMHKKFPQLVKNNGAIVDSNFGSKYFAQDAFCDEVNNMYMTENWNSPKHGICWSGDRSSSKFDASLGKVLNSLNISER